ncbi:MAG: MHS family MFS transporter [Cyclobacteriaceae bacterium]|nr:MHS family MFS transporter [Cyclobacteriaceae bacterium]
MSQQRKNSLWPVITASSVGTLIEWYDFYIFGSLATILSEQFFPKTNPTAAFLSTLATFAAGFIVRPFGALVFGRLGDKVGRKYTFLITLVLMGTSTFLIGLVPGYETIGLFAPLIVLILRLVQGLALGGEYGGAATYVAEHSPPGKRGFYTSFIQTTATLGLFVSLGVIVFIRQTMGIEEFTTWGWRIPFLLSAILVGISIYIRLRMEESPLFTEIKSKGKLSVNPIKESFGKKENLKWVLLALFGATAGQGVVWYTGQFYALSFIQKTCNIEFVQSNYIVAIALLIATPLFIFFGWWSDKIGRKHIMMAGMVLAVFLYRPVYKTMVRISDPTIKAEQSAGEPFESVTVTSSGDTTRVYKIERHFTDGTTLLETITQKGNSKEAKREVRLAGTNYRLMIALIAVQVLFVTMVYGPIAAFLVELFPTRIRYTSMSLPYHIGNGIFGGLTPFIATALATTGGPFAGLWYPMAVASLCAVVGIIFLPNRSNAEL